MSDSLDVRFGMIRDELHRDAMQTEQKLDNMRNTLSHSIASMQQSNAVQLDAIKKTVDEKLQDTLDKKLNDSFKIVSERLEQVYKGLGEMQMLAGSVGDIKKVLSNVKTRGVLGELQLGAILEQILSPDQYAANVITHAGSRDFVEYAIKLPGDDSGHVWLPIDAKFPADAYTQLLDAYDAGDASGVDQALKQLKTRVKGFAKDIQTKYIAPPETTEFAIMFVPFEGLYAELVKAGMVDILQNEYRVCIAGPTTMGALLNSIQMGFKTLAIQKRSNEVWKVLNAVKTEFDSFATVLSKAQDKINQANSELDKLVGVRTRQIQRKLGNLQGLPTEEAERLFLSDSNDV
jgi:DNA recombination protein RmuC